MKFSLALGTTLLPVLIIFHSSFPLEVTSGFCCLGSSSISSRHPSFLLAPPPPPSLLRRLSTSTTSTTTTTTVKTKPFLLLLSADNNNNDNDNKNDSHEKVKTYRKGLSSVGRGSSKKWNGSSNNNNGNGNGNGKQVVYKFGGSSLANSQRVDHVANLIRDQIYFFGYHPRAVICSAMGKTTNTLLSAGDFALEGKVDIDALRTLHYAAIDNFDLPHHVKDEVTNLLNECEDMLNGVRLLQELSPKSLDQLVSYGERCSVRIMAGRLNQLGIPAQAFDAWEIGIYTDSNFGDAHINTIKTDYEIQQTFKNRIDPSIVAVVTGFIGHDSNGKITTLGRGGSDLTATTIGAALDLDEITVWKDVDGILSADPRLVPDAIPVSDVSFEEASELAYFGAQVLHPIAMQPAMKKNIPVRVKNSYNPSHEGTVIRHRDGNDDIPERLVTAITTKRDVHLLDIHSTRMLGAYGFLSAVFDAFDKHQLSVDVLASSEVSVSLTLDKKQPVTPNCRIIKDLQPIADVTLKDNRAILTLITDVERSSDVLATVFRVFSMRGIKVEMMSQGASKVNISFILKNEQLDDAVLQLHSCFFGEQCIVAFNSDEDEEEKGEKKMEEEEEKAQQGAELFNGVVPNGLEGGGGDEEMNGDEGKEGKEGEGGDDGGAKVKETFTTASLAP